MTDPIPRLNAALEGRYRIEREIGQGGMATVYLADDLRHERKVALKVLKPELAAVVGAERFLAEIKTTANLQHPHILPLHDSGEADGFLFYVMPFVEGETLRERLDRDHQLPVDEAVRLATNVAEALEYAHSHGVIHRDIKPANILIQSGKPVISDFGIALAVGVAGGGRLTETGLSVGTPHYMSPEQATGDQSVGPATDIYALGCVLYEMLVGEPPYTGITAQAILGKIIQADPVSATKGRKSVPPNVDAAIRKSLEKLPADRFRSARDFADALADPGFRHGDGPSASSAARQSQLTPLAIALGVLALVLAASFAWALRRPEPSRPLTRVSVALPDSQAFDPGVGFVDLSADGVLLVYRGLGSDGSTPQLWSRRWDALDATPIPGTIGAIFPDVSPDGREVAFIAGDALRVVPLQGGISRTLTEGAGCCARWSPDGSWVYYATPAANGLMRVPAAGGAPDTVFELDPSAGDIGVGYPEPLPDGRGLVFVTLGAGGRRLRALDEEMGEAKDLLTGGRAPRYSPTGHLLFLDDEGTLLAVPFDAKRLELTGAAVPLVEDVALGPQGIGYFDISETGTLVYRRNARSGSSTPVWVDRDGTAREIDTGWSTSGAGNAPSVSLSPTGDRLAISMTGDGENVDLWVKRLDTGPLSRLTFEGSDNIRAWWSPDGESVTFPSTRGGAAGWDLYTKRADGSGTAELVLDRAEVVGEALYSPDGTWLIFREGPTASGRGDIYAIRPGVDSSEVALAATDFNEYSPALSPDGRWLAYVSNESGPEQVYVIPFPEGRVGGGLVQVSTNGGRSPVWAHNGRELFYRNGNDEMVVVDVTMEPTFAAGTQTVLFSMAGYFSNNGHPMYDVSPDDQRFVMLRVGEQGASGELILVQNWFDELNARVGER